MSEPDCHQREPAASSPRVWSSSALAAAEARLSRVCLTRHLPTSGIPTLLPACVFHNLPALFHAGNALEVFLQGLFPSTEPSPSLENGNLPDVSKRPSEIQVNSIFTRTHASASRLCSPRGFATRRDGVNRLRQAAALLVFGPLGYSSRQKRQCLRTGFPLALHHCPRPGTRVPNPVSGCAPGTSQPAGWLVSVKTASPYGLRAPRP